RAGRGRGEAGRRARQRRRLSRPGGRAHEGDPLRADHLGAFGRAALRAGRARREAEAEAARREDPPALGGGEGAGGRPGGARSGEAGARPVSALTGVVFTAPDGAEIAYKIRPGRDPFVLLHALGCDASLFAGFVAALPPDVGLLIPEMRVHGGSTLGWRAPSVELWADDVLRLVRQKGIARPAIVG